MQPIFKAGIFREMTQYVNLSGAWTKKYFLSVLSRLQKFLAAALFKDSVILQYDDVWYRGQMYLLLKYKVVSKHKKTFLNTWNINVSKKRSEQLGEVQDGLRFDHEVSLLQLHFSTPSVLFKVTF